MKTYTISSLLMALIILASATDEPQLTQYGITTAVQEMQRANYFAFVMLLNMVQDKIPSNTTFLMPNDRVLSKASIQENKVLEFILRHSIPSPLLFDDLQHFPTGTIIPTYQPDYMLRVLNQGRKSFFFNDVQLISINICTAGSSFRCHGINGVLSMTAENRTTPPTSSQGSPPAAVEPSTSPSRSSQPPLAGPPSMAPTTSPPPLEPSDGPRKSSSSDQLPRGLFTALASCIILSMVNLHI